LFALNYPHLEVQMMFLFPMPAWVFALIIVASDVYGATSRPDAGVAFTAHLAGAIFGLYYYRRGSRHAAAIAERLQGFTLKRKPRLRVHAPDEEDDDLSRRVDAILEKIQEHGQDSLTAKERQLLEQASRKFRQKRR
jgi:hypothetical protein